MYQSPCGAPVHGRPFFTSKTTQATWYMVRRVVLCLCTFMAEVRTITIGITKEPEALQLKQKLSPEALPQILKGYDVILERSTDGVRTLLFLSLYMPSKMVKAYGGTAALMPGMRGGDVLGIHGMRFSMSRVDLDDGLLLDTPEEETELAAEEIAVIRSALEGLLKKEQDQ